MTSTSPQPVADAARVIFDRIKGSLEATYANQFVAIEPTSGDHCMGATLSEAIGAARKKFPNRLTHAFRVGHPAAIHFGLHIR